MLGSVNFVKHLAFSTWYRLFSDTIIKVVNLESIFGKPATVTIILEIYSLIKKMKLLIVTWNFWVVLVYILNLHHNDKFVRNSTYESVRKGLIMFHLYKILSISVPTACVLFFFCLLFLEWSLTAKFGLYSICVTRHRCHKLNMVFSY